MNNSEPDDRIGSGEGGVQNDGLRWDPIRHFIAVARAGSVMAAARQLGVGHATVLRNVARLEAQLGIRLFDHVRSGYRITTEGEEVLTNALGMEEQAEAMLRRALGKNPTPEGVLKLVIADATLFDPMPLLEGFRRSAPRIELAVEDAGGAADARLAQLHADAAIVITNSPPEALVGRQLHRLRFAYFAAPAYLAGLDPAALPPERCEWVLWRHAGSTDLAEDWQWSALRRLTRQPRVGLHTARHGEALAAVRAGLGVGLLGEDGAAGLVRLPFPEPEGTVGVWLLTHPDLRRAGRVRALFDFVADRVHGAPRSPR